jgi:DNA polymerase-1
MSKSNTTKTLVLLDAHAILHRAYHALPDFATASGEPTGGLYGLCTMLLSAVTELKPDYVVACYDLPKPTYRHEAYKDYKAGRAKAEPELVSQMKRSRDIFTALSIPIYDKEGFEADDMLGTIVEQVKKDKNLRVIICSGDMDTLQLVTDKKVQVYTLKKGIKDTVLYDEEGVKARFGFGPELLPDYKGLRGDPSDNIIGIAGIGEKTGTDLITKFGGIEDIYKTLKKNRQSLLDAGIKERIVCLLEAGEEEAKFSKMLATIRRDAPIEFVLPEKIWKETVSLDVAEKLFTELEFRTMAQKLKTVLVGEKEAESLELRTEDDKEAGPAASSGPATDPFRLKKAGIALWLLNSNLTDPKEEDILAFANTKSFDVAEKALFAELENKNLTKIFSDIEEPLIPIIDKMETYGIKIDKERLIELSVVYTKEVEKLQKKIWELAGVEFNVSSPKQLGEVLFVTLGLKAKNQKKTGSGAPSTKESELEKLRDEHPIISFILEYRELTKLLSTYIDVIPTLLDKDNRLHARFLQTGTTTGRMSSKDPNLQNIPNKTDLGRAIRKSFIADKGYVFGAFDYSQIELRVAAFLSGDEKMIDIFRRGDDIHSAVAAEVFRVSREKVDKEMRRRAKVINFGIMYGMGVNALRQNLSAGGQVISRDEAQKFLNDYFDTFSGLAKYLDKVKEETKRLGYTETFFGRRRYFEGIRSPMPFIKAMAERMAINAPIQGTEADIIKLAMIQVEAWLKKEKLESDVRILLQVHDELVYEICEDKVSKVAPEIIKIMESVIDPKKISGIVCKAEASIGANWGEMEHLV